MILSLGDFTRFGAYILSENEANITFCSDTPPSINLYHIDSKKLYKTVKPDESFRRGDVYSVKLSGLDFSQYGYNFVIKDKEVIDPYATCLVGKGSWGEPFGKVFSKFSMMQVVPQTAKIIPFEKMIIYKLHMRGFTMDRPVKSEIKGNYKGVLAQLPYLKKLGVNTLAFFPLYEFDEVMPKEEGGKANYWGYGNHDSYYFAPKQAYFPDEPTEAMQSFVKQLHQNGMNIIMDMCFNEKDASFILSLLRFWALKFDIDGFNIIGSGIPKTQIERDPVLCDRILIFDNFNAVCGQEKKHVFVCNDEFMYPLRRVQNHLDGNIWELAEMVRRQSDTIGFVNYVAAPNGFTLYDAYSYCEKHNEENGEDNKDGSNYNASINYGLEGPTKDKSILKARLVAVRNALTTLLVSQGIPLINSGDEMLNSAGGNNNPYCQDNKIGWLNVSKSKDALGLREYVAKLIAFRKSHPILSGKYPLKMSDYKRMGLPDISYHSTQPWIVDIDDSKKSLGILLCGDYGEKHDEDFKDEDVMILFNFYYRKEEFSLPKIIKKKWAYVSNTAKGDFLEKPRILDDQKKIQLEGNSITILVLKKNG